MKIFGIFVLFELNSIIAGAFWAGAARNIYQPVILSLGTIFAAISLDKKPIQDIAHYNWNEEVKKLLKNKPWEKYETENEKNEENKENEESKENEENEENQKLDLKDKDNKKIEFDDDKLSSMREYDAFEAKMHRAFEEHKKWRKSHNKFREPISMIQDDIEAYIIKPTFNDVNFKYLDEL